MVDICTRYTRHLIACAYAISLYEGMCVCVILNTRMQGGYVYVYCNSRYLTTLCVHVSRTISGSPATVPDVSGRIHVCTCTCACACACTYVQRERYRQAGRQVGRQTDRQTHTQTDRQCLVEDSGIAATPQRPRALLLPDSPP